MQLAYSPGMAIERDEERSDDQDRAESPRRARRRRRLLELLKEVRQASRGPALEPEDTRGLVAAVAKDESERTYLQMILSGNRGLGDSKAAELERRYGKPQGWFDTDVYWPFSLELQDEVAKLRPEDLRFMEVAMWTHLKKAVPSKLSYMDTDRRSSEVEKPPTIISPSNPTQARVKRSS